MHQEHITQRKEGASLDQHPLQRSAFENTNTSAEEPPFQLKAGSGGTIQASMEDTLGTIQQNAQEKFGVDVSGVQFSQDNSIRDFGAVGAYEAGGPAQRTTAGGSVTIADGSADTAAHEYGHAIRAAQGYTPTADTNVNGQAVDSNPSEEAAADNIGKELLA